MADLSVNPIRSRLASKIERLPDTLDLLRAWDPRPIADAVAAGRGRDAIAVGSGGSAVIATFFARCRETLFGRPTTVCTPLTLSVANFDLSNTDVWLFSASGDNGDVRAAVAAVRIRRAAGVHLVTRDASGRAAVMVSDLEHGRVHTFPVADRKDGFLATHSLAGSLGALLLGCDAASSNPVGSRLLERLVDRVRIESVASEGAEPARILASMRRGDTLVLVADPQLATVSTLIDTSAWEASLCPVQTTDMRNFAHGRHSWLHHHGRDTVVLALTGLETRELWQDIARRLPPDVRNVAVDHGDCGRFRNAVGALSGLEIIDAIGRGVGIDPGKPGIADFGRELYDDEGLPERVATMGCSVVQKRSAVFEWDDPDRTEDCLRRLEGERLALLDGAAVGAIVLDYDGTVVASDRREEPPEQAILDELARLHGCGIRIAVATGRGGSVAEMLRSVLPKAMHARVMVGYYNGGHVRGLDVDITKEPPAADGDVATVVAWIRDAGHLADHEGLRDSGVQASVRLAALVDPDGFVGDLGRREEMTSGRLRAVRSGHSVDIVPSATSKLAVVERIRDEIEEDLIVLTLGDSGEAGGNDHEMLRGPHGMSVGRVCGGPDGVWAPLGTSPSGPAALFRILAAIRPEEAGIVRLRLADMLDRKA